MPHPAKPASAYPLGYSAAEAKRLTDQAAQLDTFTAMIFGSAGLAPGMRVLDIGSGMGDVAFLAARLVGPEGSVTGVERAASSVEIAGRRAAEAGLGNVTFVAADLADFVPEGTFDAIVGRFVLSYVPDRAAVLRRLADHLRPGGIAAFLEVDLTAIAQVPPSDLFAQARQWVLDGFAAGGTELEMGSALHATFIRAGLPAPGMIAFHPIFGAADPAAYRDLVGALRSLLPAIAREGGDPAAIDVDSLAARLLAAAPAEGVAYMSRIVGAWTRLPA